MDGKQYALTNTQLTSGHNRFTLTTVTGTPLRPTGIQLSTTKDIARSEHALNLAPSVANEELMTLVDYDGSTTKLISTVQNVSSGRFDISTLFSVENNGSPLLNEKMQDMRNRK